MGYVSSILYSIKEGFLLTFLITYKYYVSDNVIKNDNKNVNSIQIACY